MHDAITISGLVATAPRHLVTSEGLPITSFRLASTQRRFDRSQEKWIDAETNWYTVTAFRQLALNSNASIDKGQRVLVAGRLKIREWVNGERTGTTIEVEADSIGHDLAWGTAAFTRSVSTATAATAEPVDESADASAAGDQPGDDVDAVAREAESSGELEDELAPSEATEAVPVPF
jgi:single-strand DNA-binding protein